MIQVWLSFFCQNALYQGGTDIRKMKRSQQRIFLIFRLKNFFRRCIIRPYQPNKHQISVLPKT